MHKTKYRKTTRARPPGVKSDPRGGKSNFLEKQLSPTAQNHYSDLEDTCRDKITKVGVIVRYTKKYIKKNEGWGHIWPRVAVWCLKDSSKNLKVYHQNIRGLKGKLSQLSNILYSELPHLLYITEHHLIDLEIVMKSIIYFKLGAKFCRRQYKNGGVCIFVHDSIDFNTISTHHSVSRLAVNWIEF